MAQMDGNRDSGGLGGTPGDGNEILKIDVRLDNARLDNDQRGAKLFGLCDQRSGLIQTVDVERADGILSTTAGR